MNAQYKNEQYVICNVHEKYYTETSANGDWGFVSSLDKAMKFADKRTAKYMVDYIKEWQVKDSENLKIHKIQTLFIDLGGEES